LSVSTDSSDAGLRLLEDAKITDGTNSFLAVLPKTGDYTIEVQNNGDKDLVVTLTIKIN
jgi:hypothetical protein